MRQYPISISKQKPARSARRKPARDLELEGLDKASSAHLSELNNKGSEQLSPGTVLHLQHMVGNTAVQRMLAARDNKTSSWSKSKGGDRHIQRVMDVGGQMIKKVSVAKAEILKSGYTPQGGWTKAHWDRLKLWVKRKEVYSPIQWYMTGQAWSFTDWAQAAEGLDAHMQSRENRAKEKKLAAKTTKSKAIQNNLVTAMTGIAAWVDGFNNTVKSGLKKGEKITIEDFKGNEHTYTDLWDYLEKFKGQYNHWYPNGKIQSTMKGPSKKEMATNFVILRELFYALDNARSGLAHVLPDIRPGRDTLGTGTGGSVNVDAHNNPTRNDALSPEMSHDWVKKAFQMKMPLGAGASGTIDRLLNMAVLAGVGDSGKEAIAWAGFAFWNKSYSKIKGYGHTFHEIMDVAKVNYGIDYEVGKYPTKIPPG